MPKNNSHSAEKKPVPVGPEITIVAHDGQFHADDVFAVATILLAIEAEMKKGQASQDAKKAAAQTEADVAIIRSRDGAVIQAGTYVVDVGGVHDPETNRFDHHQMGGAGERANTIPYASFGLVWKKFGAALCDVGGGDDERVHTHEYAREIADIVDQKLVQSVDANDNGVAITTEMFPNVRPYGISSVIASMNPNWNESHDAGDIDQIFMNAVLLAKEILGREIQSAKSWVEGRQHVLDGYERAADKKVIVFDEKYPFEKILSEKPEPLFAVYPKDGKWYVKAIRNTLGNFENRKDLPASWAGKRGAELSAATGVPGSIFCHNKLFTASNDTKEGAIKMAEIAVNL